MNSCTHIYTCVNKISAPVGVDCRHGMMFTYGQSVVATATCHTRQHQRERCAKTQHLLLICSPTYTLMISKTSWMTHENNVDDSQNNMTYFTETKCLNKTIYNYNKCKFVVSTLLDRCFLSSSVSYKTPLAIDQFWYLLYLLVASVLDHMFTCVVGLRSWLCGCSTQRTVFDSTCFRFEPCVMSVAPCCLCLFTCQGNNWIEHFPQLSVFYWARR